MRNGKVNGIGDGKSCKVSFFEWLQELRYGKIIMIGDGEGRILNIVEAIQAMRGKRRKDTVAEQSPEGESSSPTALPR